MLPAVTGWDVDADELRTTAERIVDAKQALQHARRLDAGRGHAARPLPRGAAAPGRGRGASFEPRRPRPHDRAPTTRHGAGRPRDCPARAMSRGSEPRGPRPRSEAPAIEARRTTPRPPTTARRDRDPEIDGREVTVPEGTTIWEAARAARDRDPGPLPRARPRARRRVPDVRRRGRRAAHAARLVRPALRRRHGGPHESPLVQKQPQGPDRAAARRISPPGAPARADGRRRPARLADELDADALTLARGQRRPADDSSPVIPVDHQACILCDRCIRACDDVQDNDVIGRTGKGYATRIGFDLDAPMGESTCVACGECVAACPTGALTTSRHRAIRRRARHLEAVDSRVPLLRRGLRDHVPRGPGGEPDRVRRRARQPGATTGGCA